MAKEPSLKEGGRDGKFAGLMAELAVQNQKLDTIANILQQGNREERNENDRQRKERIASDVGDKLKSIPQGIASGVQSFAAPAVKGIAEKFFETLQLIGGLTAFNWLQSGGLEKVKTVISNIVDGFKKIANGDFAGVAADLYNWMKEKNGAGSLNEILGLTIGAAGVTLATLFGSKTGIRLAAAGFAFAAADGIGNWIEKQTGSEVLGDVSSLTIKGASLGYAFGPTGALVGAIIGFGLGVGNSISAWVKEKTESKFWGDVSKIAARGATGAAAGAVVGGTLGLGIGAIPGAIVGFALGIVGGIIEWVIGEENQAIIGEKWKQFKDKMTEIGKFFYDAETGKVMGIDWGVALDEALIIFEDAKTWLGTKLKDIGKFFYDAETGKVLGIDWGAALDEALIIFEDAKTWVNTKLTDIGKFFYDAETGKVLGIDWGAVLDESLVIFEEAKTWIKTKVSDIGKFFYDPETGKVLGIDWVQLAVDLHATHDKVETWIKDKVTDLGKFFYDAETGKVLGIHWGQLITDISNTVVETAKGIPEKIGNMFKQLWNRITTTFTNVVNNIIGRVNGVLPRWAQIPTISLEGETGDEVPQEETPPTTTTAAPADTFDPLAYADEVQAMSVPIPASQLPDLPPAMPEPSQRLINISRRNELIDDFANAGSAQEQQQVILQLQRLIDSMEAGNAAGSVAMVNQVTQNHSLTATPLTVEVPDLSN